MINTSAQTVVEVGDDLFATIENAEDGTEIIVKSGSHKAAHNTINIIDKSLTIRGEEGTPKPKVYIKSISVSGTDISLILEGIEFSGATYDSLTGVEDTVALTGEYVVNLTTDFTSGTDIIIRDCTVRNFERSVIRGDRADNYVNNILVDDCIIFDLRGGGSYGPFRLKSKITFDDFTIQNSTFHHIQGTLIDCKDMVSFPANILVKNCTFYKWGGVISDKYLFEITANDQANMMIRSCILGKTNPASDPEALVYGFRIMEEAYAEITNTAMTPDFSPDDSTYAQVSWDLDQYNAVDLDPEFQFPDTANFYIPLESDINQMSPEGTIIGDPRWDSEIPESVDNIFESSDFTLFPNPASEQLTILNGGTGYIEIYNSVGLKIDELRLLNSSIEVVNISDYIPGIYFIRLNETTLRRVVVE